MDAAAIDSPLPEDTSPPSRVEIPFKRILIYGVTGSGKTTMARHLSEETSIPWTEVDTLTWDPGWVEVPVETQRDRIQAICAQDEWILDSAYGKWLEIPLERVELIIGLDYPRWRSLRQLLWRTVSRSVTKEKVCNGNVESLRGMFSRDSIIGWHFKSFARKRERVYQWAKDPRWTVVILRHPRELDAWLAEVRG